jgi:hypothetical protein
MIQRGISVLLLNPIYFAQHHWAGGPGAAPGRGPGRPSMGGVGLAGGE